MVTNINLSSPELAEKKTFTGKSVLVLSVSLLAVVFAVYGVLFFLKSRYSSQDQVISGQISQEQGKSSGAAFADILDFQERLNLADKAIDDHAYWDSLLKRMSAYVIPEVKLTKFSGKEDQSGAGTVEISGTAPNLDAISRELILLKDFPNLDSLEFKKAGASQAGSSQPGGVTFDASLKINKTAFQK